MARVIACDNCGAVISSRYDYCPECNAKIKKHRAIWLLIVLAIIIALLFIPFGGDGTPGVVDYFKDLTQVNDEHVRGVKYGSPNSYPDITYADAFENFFGSPTWTYFRGTQERSNAEHDVVEFTGTCLYRDSEVKARIQFVLSEDGKTFEATYLSFNDVPQSKLILNALIEKAFSEYQSKG